MDEKTPHEQMTALLTENNRLLTENNEMLRIMRRNARIGFVFKLVWLVILIGGPLIVYWYFIEPLLTSLPFGQESVGVLETQLQFLQEYAEQLQR